VRIVIVSDQLEFQEKTPSIKWMYETLSNEKKVSVKYISTGMSLSRLVFGRVSIRNFIKNALKSESPIKFLFPVYPVLNSYTKKFFIFFWSKVFINSISEFHPDLIVFEAGIPSIILYSMKDESLVKIKKIYKISDPVGFFRKNPILEGIDQFILKNRSELNCKVSAPSNYCNIFPDQILRPGVPDYASEINKSKSERLIVYIGIYPLPHGFIKSISEAYPDYQIICTCKGDPNLRNVKFVGTINQKNIEKILKKASIGIMFFPSNASDWFLASSNKLALYNALRIPVISNNCGADLKKYCIYNIGEGFDKNCKAKKAHSWKKYTEEITGLY
jgi:hypothetical protein